MTAGRIAVVVLAGGASLRFGSDKLAADLAGRPLLQHVVAGVIAAVGEADLVVVGPTRPLPYAARFVSEEPPGGGPAAGLVAGLTASLDAGAATVVVVPGDAPGAGAGARALLAGLARADAVVAVDASGRDQPLQLALTRAGAAALVAAAGDRRGAGESARALVGRLEPPAVRCPLPADAAADVDRPEDLQAWADRLSSSR